MRRYISRTRRTPLEPVSGGFGIAPILPQDDRITIDNERDYGHPTPFDLISVAPTSVSTTWLVTDGVTSSSGILSGPCPNQCYGVVDGIYPYLETVAGTQVNSFRIPGANTTVAWSIFVNGRPDARYGNIGTILPWNRTYTLPLIYFGQGEQVTCSVLVTDPLGLYSYVGIQIKGRFVDRRDRL